MCEALKQIDDPSVEIRAWMIRHGLKVTDVANSMGLSHSSVSLWLSCRSTSSRIADFFKEIGCPEKYVEELVTCRTGCQLSK